MKLVAAVSHTPWIGSRVASMARLRADLAVDEGDPQGGPDEYIEMVDRAHTSVWSARMWDQALRSADGQGHCVFLQDDDRVPPRGLFWLALRAIIAVVPDQLLGLHLHHPGALAAAAAGERFVTTMSCVGVGYALPTSLLADFLGWRALLGDRAIYDTSEDNLLDAWAVRRRRRVWHTVPAIVSPDASLGSTGGGGGRADADDQYMRATVLGWERFDEADLVDVAWWRRGLRIPPRHLAFGGAARPGVSHIQAPAGADGCAIMRSS